MYLHKICGYKVSSLSVKCNSSLSAVLQINEGSAISYSD